MWRCSRRLAAAPATLDAPAGRVRSCRRRAKLRIGWPRCSTAPSRVTLLCGSGCQGAHDRARSRWPNGSRPDGPRAEGQGACRVGQSLRCRHDRADRLLVGLLRDDATATSCSCSAPTSPIGSSTRRDGVRIAQVDHQAGAASAGARRSISASSATCARRSHALLPLLKEKPDATHLDQARRALRKGAQGPRRACRRHSRARRSIHPQQVAKAISDLAAEDAVFTCDVGLPTVWAARYLGDERQAAADRLVLARLDGQCDGPGDRRPGGVSRAGR